jgi:hypothetical protein
MQTVFESTSVKIVETVDPEGEVQRQLFIGPPFTNVQGAMKVDRPTFHVHDFTKKLTFGALSVRGGIRDALFLGLGAGIVVRAVSDMAPQAKLDIVDINLELFDACSRYFFNLDAERFTLYQEDAYGFVKRSNKRYDFVCCDIFGASLEVPDYLLSGEFATAAKRCLADDGIVAFNTHRALHKNMAESLCRHFKFVFSLPGNNALLLCTDAWPQFVLDARVEAVQRGNNVDMKGILDSMTLMRRVDFGFAPHEALV